MCSANCRYSWYSTHNADPPAVCEIVIMKNRASLRLFQRLSQFPVSSSLLQISFSLFQTSLGPKKDNTRAGAERRQQSAFSGGERALREVASAGRSPGWAASVPACTLRRWEGGFCRITTVRETFSSLSPFGCHIVDWYTPLLPANIMWYYCSVLSWLPYKSLLSAITHISTYVHTSCTQSEGGKCTGDDKNDRKFVSTPLCYVVCSSSLLVWTHE